MVSRQLFERTSCIAALVLALLLTAASAGAEDKAPTRAAAPSTAQVPEGYLLVEDGVWFQLADEPDHHFLEARRDYLSNEPIDAAEAILKATAVLKLATAHAQGEAKKPLEASILELETLAAKLEHDTVRVPRSLDRIFSRSFLALANYNEYEARRHLRDEEPEKAARHLRAASRNVVHAAVWRGIEVEDQLLHAVNEVEKAAGRLLSQEARHFAEAIKALDDMHTYSDKIKALNKAAE